MDGSTAGASTWSRDFDGYLWPGASLGLADVRRDQENEAFAPERQRLSNQGLQITPILQATTGLSESIFGGEAGALAARFPRRRQRSLTPPARFDRLRSKDRPPQG